MGAFNQIYYKLSTPHKSFFCGFLYLLSVYMKSIITIDGRDSREKSGLGLSMSSGRAKVSLSYQPFHSNLRLGPETHETHRFRVLLETMTTTKF